jgi:hypothetical protein
MSIDGASYQGRAMRSLVLPVAVTNARHATQLRAHAKPVDGPEVILFRSRRREGNETTRGPGASPSLAEFLGDFDKCSRRQQAMLWPASEVCETLLGRTNGLTVATVGPKNSKFGL